ncbi:hypothetical protein C7N43_18635 [Sphingobacteriales bacterium UPWRP_1]|nr:hypothetical protein B6N25_06480 [Sphingobacteriales bacterium TSM_CSS]PSJ75469.1 hypothetical protein C7N43_18635 [Sphingobacteriales bacterium UPWRP_1]
MLRTSYFTLINFLLLFMSNIFNAGATGVLKEYPGANAANCSSTSAGDVKLLLLGMVLDETTLQPLGNMTIELIDNFSKEVEHCVSGNNGNFYFPLQSDKLYTVLLLRSDGVLLCSKTVSTVNRLQPEVLQVLLSVPAAK